MWRKRAVPLPSARGKGAAGAWPFSASGEAHHADDHLHSDDHLHDDGHDDQSHDRHAPSVPHPLLKSLVLLGLGIYFLHLWISSDLNNYVNLRFGWLVLVAAALFLVLAMNGISATIRGREGHAHHEHGWADHIHLPPSWTVLLIVGVPLLLGVLVPSQPLGAQAVGMDRSLDVGAMDAAAIPATDSLQWTVLDWLRAYSAGGSPERINGKEADLIGFVYRREDDPKGSFVVMRFLMVHCSADAYAVGIPVMWANAEALPIDGWVRVRGTVNVGSFRGQTLPTITATSVEENIERPKQPYLYK
jgi:putative membrane protein